MILKYVISLSIRVLVREGKIPERAFSAPGWYKKTCVKRILLSRSGKCCPEALLWPENGHRFRGGIMDFHPFFQFFLPLTLSLVLWATKQVDSHGKDWRHPWLMEKMGGQKKFGFRPNLGHFRGRLRPGSEKIKPPPWSQLLGVGAFWHSGNTIVPQINHHFMPVEMAPSVFGSDFFGPLCRAKCAPSLLNFQPRHCF